MHNQIRVCNVDRSIYLSLRSTVVCEGIFMEYVYITNTLNTVTSK